MIGGNNGRNFIDGWVDNRLDDGWAHYASVDRVGAVQRQEALDARLVTPTPTPEVDERLASLPEVTNLPYIEPANPDSIEGIICSFNWPQGCAYWIRLATCESSLRPSSIGYSGRYIGLFQVWTGHGYGFNWLLDPYNNTLAAWELSNGGTYTGAWQVCQWQ